VFRTIVPFVVAGALLASNVIAHAQNATSNEPAKNFFAQVFAKPEAAKPAAAATPARPANIAAKSASTAAKPASAKTGILAQPQSVRVAIAKAMIKADLMAAKSSGGALPSGLASVYAFETGSRTASGRKLVLDGFTAAHRTLPFGTNVVVTNKRNGKTVTVVINDRGPFVKGRVIDVTPAAAKALGFSGLAPVSLAVMKNEPKKVTEAGI
jgi:rare lipoprotein A